MNDDLMKRLRSWSEGDAYLAPVSTKEMIDSAADRIEELEFVLSFISNINYGNGPDVTMEHQGWAKRALGEKTDD
jgi:hypothetical protein